MVSKRDLTVRQAAEELGVSVKWIRKQVAAGTISPHRRGNKPNGRFALTADEVTTLGSLLPAESDASATASSEPEAPATALSTDSAADPERARLLARIGDLESDRNNLQAHVAWARAIAEEQQKALEYERERTQKLMSDLEAQRTRVEALKALSAVDRLLGRHKAI